MPLAERALDSVSSYLHANNVMHPFRTLAGLLYLFLLVLAVFTSFVSCIYLLSQAVRTGPNRTLRGNFNTVVIGASYAIVLATSVILCVKRRLAIRLRLQRVSRTHRIIQKGDVPKSVHQYISQEYVRSCLITHYSQPKDIYHEGWGRPGTRYEGIRFRRALLDTVKDIDTLARSVLPSQPPLQPHLRMLHQFRFVLPLLPVDDAELTAMHYYDSAIEIARYSSSEPTEQEFLIGMEAVASIRQSLEECLDVEDISVSSSSSGPL